MTLLTSGSWIRHGCPVAALPHFVGGGEVEFPLCTYRLVRIWKKGKTIAFQINHENITSFVAIFTDKKEKKCFAFIF